MKKSAIFLFVLLLFSIFLCACTNQKEPSFAPLLSAEETNFASPKMVEELQLHYGLGSLEDFQLYAKENRVQINFYFLEEAAIYQITQALDLGFKQFHNTKFHGIAAGEYEGWLVETGYLEEEIAHTQIFIYSGDTLVRYAEYENGEVVEDFDGLQEKG